VAILGTGRAGGATVKLTADTSQFNRELAGAQRTFSRTTDGFHRQSRVLDAEVSRLGRGAIAGSGAFSHLGRSIAFASGSFLGAAGFVGAVKQSINAASDLHEQINKVDVVFRGSQRSVLQWSENTAKGLGIARGEALGFAATFGNLLVPMGIARNQAARMSTQLVQLAADLASFNNANPEDVLQALQSGLAGQIRPLRQFGIFIDQARIKAEALRLGLVKGTVDQGQARVATEQLSIAQAKYNQALKDFGPNTTQVASAHVTLERAQRAVSKAASGATGQLSQQQKVMATMSIIMRDSRDAQGDFARTSGGLANQQRILRAEITNLEEKLGKTLLPTVLRLVTRMTDWLSSTQNQERLIRRLSATVSTAATVIKTMFDVMRGAADLVGGWKNLAIAIGIATVASKAFFVAMRVQAALTAVAIRATLISTGIGALAVAFGVAVAVDHRALENGATFPGGLGGVLQEGRPEHRAQPRRAVQPPPRPDGRVGATRENQG
jgi:hypothetical protein